MESGVEAKIPPIAGGEIIPTIGKSYFIAIRQIKLKSHIGANSWKQDASRFVCTENRADQVNVGNVVVHIGKTRIIRNAYKWQPQFAVSRQQIVRIVMNESEVILYHTINADVAEYQ